ncbi:MAG: ribosomal RNA small subunit methyltransferase A [Candidatus Jacksonbacteria bacterium RIFOXYC2_FULL_44_29]|nr:MAG: Ribosomal RNA small subunit methyltransferase A [Parcubacteria group bacterium GW2011_GWC2_44_22]OGY78485.1 MAG: ribosomal RNA small subunit methyltransferase A [Candidatus Jacksonbacteria bacterium RIFOXYC2_FULL_44_29]OGY81142.1 MAG: ribosomal RNA small subunit methyltransferase A [Candidatus Jacksonbacteria bacterium RIFOXYD2_FULL_43_21]HBH45744.1 ribosomal RNA small subunit methyltransferase A [Candidatus Jacksonbacteria bacterium]HCE49063.1 ribosomal RNA small subunit methyltransfer
MIHSDLLSPAKLKNILLSANINPKKSLGQNFLIDRNIVNKVVSAADLSKNDLVIEVGAGLGVLTVPLASKAKTVVAYEIDARLLPILEEVTEQSNNVEVRGEDVLNFKFQILNFKTYKVVGNLPYYIAPRILRLFLSESNPPESLVVIIQQEVAQRICAQPPQTSKLSLAVQFYGEPKIITTISRSCFWPMPNVDSALLKIVVKPDAGRQAVEECFFALLKAGFASKRKLLISNLTNYLLKNRAQWEEIFLAAKLPVLARAEQLSMEDWLRLAGEWKEMNIKNKN